jgi:hypothetical protein
VALERAPVESQATIERGILVLTMRGLDHEIVPA